jgi:hypothetical protein
MARKTKFIYKYKPKYHMRDTRLVLFILLMIIMVKDLSWAQIMGSLLFFGILSFNIMRALSEYKYTIMEFRVYNTGFEFPNVGLFMDSEEYTNFKDVEKIEQIDNYLTIKVKGGKFYEIPLERVSYVGRLSFAKELMEMKKKYDDYRKRRRTVNRRKRQAKRLERQKQQAA